MVMTAIVDWLRKRGAHPLGGPGVTAPAAGKTRRRPADALAKSAAIDTLRRAIDNRERDVWVDGRGTLVRILPDDHDGARHQRLLVRLAEGDIVLIAHNIDVAPRVPVREGTELTFKGEFHWNDRGGVVHWTHHDPDGSHTGGWVRAGGKTYD